METTTKTYSVTCTCGDKLRVEADSREQAVSELKGGVDELSLANHAAERHLGDDARRDRAPRAPHPRGGKRPKNAGR